MNFIISINTKLLTFPHYFHLQRNCFGELHRALLQNDREVLENATPTPEQLQNLSLPFLVKIVANSAEVLRFLVHNVYDLSQLSFVIYSDILLKILSVETLYLSCIL